MRTSVNFWAAITPWVVCISASLFFAYELTQLHMLNAISPMLMKDLGLNATGLGSLASTYILADVLFLLPAGIIIDRFSPRKVILYALLVCILGTFAFAMAESFFIASISHFLSGIGNAFCFMSCMILASRWFPAGKQAMIMGIVFTIGMLGGVIAQSPFSMMANSLGWRGALMVDGCIGIAVFIIIFMFVYNPPNMIKDEVQEQGSFWRNFRICMSRQNILCGMYTGLMNLPLMILAAVVGSLYLTQVHSIPLASASFIAGMICLGTIVGSPIGGYLSDKKGLRRQLMLLGPILSIMIMGLIMYLPSPTFAQLTFLFFLLGLFTSSQILGYPTITESNPSHLVGTSLGIAGVIIMGSAMLAGPFSGYLMDLFWDGTMIGDVPRYSIENFRTAFWLFPISFLISYVATLFIEEPQKINA